MRSTRPTRCSRRTGFHGSSRLTRRGTSGAGSALRPRHRSRAELGSRPVRSRRPHVAAPPWTGRHAACPRRTRCGGQPLLQVTQRVPVLGEHQRMFAARPALVSSRARPSQLWTRPRRARGRLGQGAQQQALAAGVVQRRTRPRGGRHRPRRASLVSSSGRRSCAGPAVSAQAEQAPPHGQLERPGARERPLVQHRQRQPHVAIRYHHGPAAPRR